MSSAREQYKAFKALPLENKVEQLSQDPFHQEVTAYEGSVGELDFEKVVAVFNSYFRIDRFYLVYSEDMFNAGEVLLAAFEQFLGVYLPSENYEGENSSALINRHYKQVARSKLMLMFHWLNLNFEELILLRINELVPLLDDEHHEVHDRSLDRALNEGIEGTSAACCNNDAVHTILFEKLLISDACRQLVDAFPQRNAPQDIVHFFEAVDAYAFEIFDHLEDEIKQGCHAASVYSAIRSNVIGLLPKPEATEVDIRNVRESTIFVVSTLYMHGPHELSCSVDAYRENLNQYYAAFIRGELTPISVMQGEEGDVSPILQPEVLFSHVSPQERLLLQLRGTNNKGVIDSFLKQLSALHHQAQLAKLPKEAKVVETDEDIRNHAATPNQMLPFVLQQSDFILQKALHSGCVDEYIKACDSQDAMQSLVSYFHKLSRIARVSQANEEETLDQNNLAQGLVVSIKEALHYYLENHDGSEAFKNIMQVLEPNFAIQAPEAKLKFIAAIAQNALEKLTSIEKTWLYKNTREMYEYIQGFAELKFSSELDVKMVASAVPNRLVQEEDDDDQEEHKSDNVVDPMEKADKQALKLVSKAYGDVFTRYVASDFSLTQVKSLFTLKYNEREVCRDVLRPNISNIELIEQYSKQILLPRLSYLQTYSQGNITGAMIADVAPFPRALTHCLHQHFDDIQAKDFNTVARLLKEFILACDDPKLVLLENREDIISACFKAFCIQLQIPEESWVKDLFEQLITQNDLDNFNDFSAISDPLYRLQGLANQASSEKAIQQYIRMILRDPNAITLIAQSVAEDEDAPGCDQVERAIRRGGVIRAHSTRFFGNKADGENAIKLAVREISAAELGSNEKRVVKAIIKAIAEGKIHYHQQAHGGNKAIYQELAGGDMSRFTVEKSPTILEKITSCCRLSLD